MNNKQSLYTKYRPSNFNQVIGQNVAKDILINSIAKNKINHAYLFYGIRGTGKTTLARIFAKAINCSNLENNNPCDNCDSCVSITNGSAFDVIEIDAASNNGVDEIRTIKENTSYLTTSANYKVYIIDEVHMLTKAAFNALLKTLEEPPKNTIFLLATTEMQKIPQTVLSRAVIINLEVMSDEDIKEGLKVVCDGEGINYDEESLDYIVMVAGGSLRDGISALETTLLYNEELSVENTINALGLIKRSEIERMITNNVTELIDNIDKTDKDPRKLSLLILEVLMDLIKSGHTKYVDILNSIINSSNTIKDPSLLKIALKSSFYGVNVSHETLKENGYVSCETEPIEEIVVENVEIEENITLEIPVENTKVKMVNETETPINTELNDTQDDNLIVEKNEEIEKNSDNTIVENKPIIKEDELNVITDFADVNNYMYIIKKNDSTELSKATGRWRHVDNYIATIEYKEIVATLVRTQPLAATDKTIIVGFHNESQINEFKRISLTPLYFKFIKEIIGEYKFILPINSDSWSKLMAIKDQTELREIHTDISVNPNDFIISDNESQNNKLTELFGEGNISHE